MTVRQLIEKLEQTDPDARVTTNIEGYSVSIDGVYHLDTIVELSHTHPED